MQGIADDHPEIAQRVFKNHEKSTDETGFEPATWCSQNTRDYFSNILETLVIA